MKSYKPLQDAFRKLNQSTVAWHKSARFPKTAETANSVLHREAVTDASTLAYLGHCLGMSNKQVVALLDDYALEVPQKAVEVAVLRKLIDPVEMNESEHRLVVKFRELDDNKKKIISDMVGAL